MIEFMAGSLFTLFLVALCLLLAFKVAEYKESREERRESNKRPLPSPTQKADMYGSIKPLTTEQIANMKNEELQAFEDILNTP